jgi:tRNA-specific 2-thiouridylase
MRVAIAMSGGVDSSVAAALLKQDGHDVIGVTMRIMPSDNNSTHAETDAANVARRLGIPHHVLDFRDIFARQIIDYFCREYSLGRTPNPCILCNKYIKFGALWEKASKMGADFLATGHYARIEKDNSSGKLLLKKGQDRRKDQSYFLCQLTQEQLSHVLFPIGQLTKDKVRRIAAELGLPVASRPESQEICFIPDDNHASFLKNYMPQAARPGPILDELGNILGQHRGITSYTIGQRKGLGIAAAKPLYVTAIEPASNTVVVGTKEQTYASELVAGNLNWIAIPAPEHSIKVKARVRYRHPEAEAIITPQDNNTVYVKFAEPQMAITPGQAVAFYDGDTVIGGGTIIKQGR